MSVGGLSLCIYLLCLICRASAVSNPRTGNQSPAPLGNTLPRKGNQDDTVTDEEEAHLRFVGEFRDQTLTSGDKVQFKCRVDSQPNDRMVYTWYKDNVVFTQNENKHRVTIRNKPTGSKLTIRSLLTTDAGEYRCEASNGLLRNYQTAKLKVGFKLPPTDDHVVAIPEGKCEVYSMQACKGYLSGSAVYVDPFMPQKEMEEKIATALSHIANAGYVSPKCKHYAYPAFCNFVFSPCEYITDPKTGKRKAERIRLCREDCELMKYDVCAEEYLNNKKDDFMKKIFSTANCSQLPATTSSKVECTKIGLTAVSDKSKTCYNETGVEYRGVASTTKSGSQCQQWPSELVIRFKELAGGHNFCRNPGKQMKMPWCYTSSDHTKPEECNVQKCELPSKGTDIMLILIPSLAIPFVLGCIAVALCVCRKKSGKSGKGGDAKPTPGKRIDMADLNFKKTKVPELNASSVHLVAEIGESVYGRVYKAKVLPNPCFSTNYPVAVKTLRESFLQSQAEEFQREVEVFAQLQHENVACLKAIVMQTSLRCMIFEYTDNIELQEYLSSRSPQSDVTQHPASSGSSHASVSIEQAEFIRMAVQVASGLEYLASNNYVHRDLAARNILVCGNLDLKISNLGVVKDSYLTSYYRSPQGGQMLPIRWMAPESLQSWQFSDKSTVWSFGVLLWEMFSYGMQPYCGYSNQEVLDMISRRQLLSCPDQCPAKIYSLMHECWATRAFQRPDFKDLRAKLQGWEGTATSRVTSQLAQGIQLPNPPPEGARGQYNRLYQTSSIGGSSGITYSSAIGPTPSPPPPPQYSNSFQLPGSSPSTFVSNNFAPLNVSPASQLYRSSSGTTTSHTQPPGYHRHPGYSTNPPINHYNENYAEGNQQHLSASDDYAAPYHKRGQTYRKGPSSYSSRSSSSCASSSREQYAPVHTRRQISGENAYLENMSPPPFSGPGNRSLNGVAENDTLTEDENQTRNQAYLQSSLPPHPQYATNYQPTSTQIPTKSHANPDPHRAANTELQSPDMLTESAKAISCDSGLPPDEADLNTVDARVPLLVQPPPPVPCKSPHRGGVSRMMT